MPVKINAQTQSNVKNLLDVYRNNESAVNMAVINAELAAYCKGKPKARGALQAWLVAAIEAFDIGRPVPEVRTVSLLCNFLT